MFIQYLMIANTFYRRRMSNLDRFNFIPLIHRGKSIKIQCLFKNLCLYFLYHINDSQLNERGLRW